MSNAQSCADLNRDTEHLSDRVSVIAGAKPACACEDDTLSEHSPGVVGAEEVIVRMVCVPMHVHKTRLEVLASFFSHAVTRGLSVQRMDIASDNELLACVEGFLQADEKRVWLGYVEASVSSIRDLRLLDDGAQSFCVADAALSDNQAHAEVHCAYDIPEADAMEYRAALMNIFNGKNVQNRKSLRGGAVWQDVQDEFKKRPLPSRWEAMT